MEKITTYRLYLLVLLLGVAFQACRKLDDKLTSMENGLSATAAPETVLVGDSLTIIGRLHLDESPAVSVAGVPVAYKEAEAQDYPDIPYPIEALRFEVTADMGQGRQPLEIRLGNKFQVLYVNILRQPPAGTSGPDTTLVVEKLFDGNIPGFTERYTELTGASGQQNTYFTGRSVTAEGIIYLQSGRDIFRFENGQMQSLLKTGDLLTIDGQQVRVKQYITSRNEQAGDSFSAMAVSRDNSIMYLSVYAEVPGEDASTGAWYLLKTDPELSGFNVLNRTMHRYSLDSTWLDAPWSPEGGFWLYTDNNAYSPEQTLESGPVESTNMLAQNMFIDAQHRLLFDNSTYSARLEPNGRISKFKDDGVVKYTPDGMRAFIVSQLGLTLFDLELQEPLANVSGSYENWNFLSFEENPDWKFQQKIGYISTQGSLMAMPNGEVLSLPNGSQQSSIGAINLETTSIYTFAGIERGFVNSDGLEGVQNQETGQARYVTFNPYQNNEYKGNYTFIGMDNRNNIYFMRGGESRRVAGRNRPMPPEIYRIKKP